MIERHITFNVHPDKTGEFEQFFADQYRPAMTTSPGFVKVELLREAGSETRYQMVLRFEDADSAAGWRTSDVDRVICHQVGSGHRREVLSALGVDETRDFSTFADLGNIGTVSVPLTAARAAEEGFLRAGDRVGLLGIGSGLNCLMLGVQW